MAIAPLPEPSEPSVPGTVDEVVHHLDRVTETLGFDFPPHLVRVDGDPRNHDTWEIELEPIPSGSLSERLLGYTAPPAAWAIGGLTGGWTAPDIYDDHEARRGRFLRRPSSHPDAVRVRSLVLVSRSGQIAARMHIADGRRIEEAPASGLAVDGMRRSLGLPTEPAAMPVAELLTSLWLADVEAAAGDAHRRGESLRWPAVAKLHPALRLLSAAGERVKADDLVASAAALGRVIDWTGVRRHVTERAWLAGIVDPDLGRWMDEGMLARYIVSSFPPIPALRAMAARRLRRSVAERLEEAVARLHPDLELPG